MKVEPDHIWWVWFRCHIDVSHVIQKKVPTETQTELWQCQRGACESVGSHLVHLRHDGVFSQETVRQRWALPQV